jgi:cation transport regulator ChaB
MPGKEDLPSTLRRSPRKAQETWVKAHDSAVEQYGEGQRSHRTAYAALKHSFQKVGDRWEPKSGKGPSDPQAAKSGAPARRGGKTAGGVDANASMGELREQARKLDVPGRSRMSKGELVDALKKASGRATAHARARDKG